MNRNSHPQIPIQRAILNRFHDVDLLDLGDAFEIGQGAGHFEDAVMGPGAEVEGVHGLLEGAFAALVDAAVFADEAARHVGVGVDAGVIDEALHLDAAGFVDAGLDHFARFATAVAAQLLVFDRRDIDMEIDSVEEGAADPLAVFLDLVGGTATLPGGIAEISAGT